MNGVGEPRVANRDRFRTVIAPLSQQVSTAVWPLAAGALPSLYESIRSSKLRGSRSTFNLGLSLLIVFIDYVGWIGSNNSELHECRRPLSQPSLSEHHRASR